MEVHGFIRDILDVKLLILFVASRAEYPMSLQKIYELCFQDDSLSYFDLSIAVPQMVESGHLAEIEKDCYVITEKGRGAEEATEDAVPFPLRERAQAAVKRFNEQSKRDGFARTKVIACENGSFRVEAVVHDEHGELMMLALPAQTRQQARTLEAALRTKADQIYRTVMGLLLE